jgi:hypothetical protein
MQLFEANGYYFVFTMKLQSNKKTFNTSRLDLTNLYKQQKDLKEINLSRVSGVQFYSKLLLGEGYYRADRIYFTACFSNSLSSRLGCASALIADTCLRC